MTSPFYDRKQVLRRIHAWTTVQASSNAAWTVFWLFVLTILIAVVLAIAL